MLPCYLVRLISASSQGRSQDFILGGAQKLRAEGARIEALKAPRGWEKALSPIYRRVRRMTRLQHDEVRSVDRPGMFNGICLTLTEKSTATTIALSSVASYIKPGNEVGLFWDTHKCSLT